MPLKNDRKGSDKRSILWRIDFRARGIKKTSRVIIIYDVALLEYMQNQRNILCTEKSWSSQSKFNLIFLHSFYRSFYHQTKLNERIFELKNHNEKWRYNSILQNISSRNAKWSWSTRNWTFGCSGSWLINYFFFKQN